MSAYRTALAAIDNAEAVPLGDDDRAGAIELSPVGVHAAERPRRVLTDADMLRIVEGEAAELRSAAVSFADADPDRSSRLDLAADLLDAIVRSAAELPGAAGR